MIRSYRRLGWVAVALLAAAPGKAQPDPIDVKVVKYKQLGDIVTQNKGKVIVVDFWATWCIPCRKEFPHLVDLHKKYGKDGVVAISVSLDDPKEAETTKKVKEFLQMQGASFTNLILDEPPEVWQKKLESETVPLVFVFNQKREIYKKYGDGANYSDIEADVRTLLEQKK